MSGSGDQARPAKVIPPTNIDLSVVPGGISDAGISASIVPSAVDLQAGIAAISNERSNGPVVSRFIRFAGALALIPFIIYSGVLFGLRSAASSIVLPRGFSPPLVAGIAAIFAINIITATFTLLAVREEGVYRAPPSIAGVTSETADSVRPKTE